VDKKALDRTVRKISGMRMRPDGYGSCPKRTNTPSSTCTLALPTIPRCQSKAVLYVNDRLCTRKAAVQQNTRNFLEQFECGIRHPIRMSPTSGKTPPALSVLILDPFCESRCHTAGRHDRCSIEARMVAGWLSRGSFGRGDRRRLANAKIDVLVASHATFLPFCRTPRRPRRRYQTPRYPIGPRTLLRFHHSFPQ
jgi:hypothetical protein